MNKLKTIGTVAMIGLIMPVSLLASIQDVLKSDALTELQEQVDNLIEEYEDLKDQISDTSDVNEKLALGVQALLKFVEIDMLRLEIDGLKIEGIEYDSHPYYTEFDVEETLTSELDVLNDALDETREGIEAASAGGEYDTDALLALYQDLTQKLHPAVRVFRLRVRAVARFEIYQIHLARLTEKIINPLTTAGLWSGDIVSSVEEYRDGVLADMRQESTAAYSALSGLGYGDSLAQLRTGYKTAAGHINETISLKEESNNAFKELLATKNALIAANSGGGTGGSGTDYGQTVSGVDKCPGTCQNTSQACSGTWQTGLCPGPSTWKCCSPSDSTGSTGGTSNCTGSASDQTLKEYKEAQCGALGVVCSNKQWVCEENTTTTTGTDYGQTVSGVDKCPGTCQNTSQACSGTWQTGLCPGPSTWKCCATSTTTTTTSTGYTGTDYGQTVSGVDKCPGTCQSTSQACSGTWQTGLCPGPSTWKCCTSGSTTTTTTTGTAGSGTCSGTGYTGGYAASSQGVLCYCAAGYYNETNTKCSPVGGTAAGTGGTGGLTSTSTSSSTTTQFAAPTCPSGSTRQTTGGGYLCSSSTKPTCSSYGAELVGSNNVDGFYCLTTGCPSGYHLRNYVGSETEPRCVLDDHTKVSCPSGKTLSYIEGGIGSELFYCDATPLTYTDYENQTAPTCPSGTTLAKSSGSGAFWMCYIDSDASAQKTAPSGPSGSTKYALGTGSYRFAFTPTCESGWIVNHSGLGIYQCKK